MNSNPLIFRFVANRLRDMSKIALMLSFVSVALLGCGGGGGGGTAGNGNGNGMMPPPADPVMRDFTNGDTPTSADRTGDTGNDVFTITGDTTGTDATMNLILEGTIDGRAGSDRVELNTGAEVASIAFASTAPMDGALHLQNIETITLGGGVVNGAIDARAATASVSFNLNSGTTGALMGGGSDDAFTLAGDMVANAGTPEAALTIGGVIDGMAGSDTVQLNEGATVASIAFSSDDPTGGALNLQNVETITINGGRVAGNIDASAATAGVTFNLNSRTIRGNNSDDRGVVTGSPFNDVFNFGSGQQLFLRGGDGTDQIRLNEGAVFERIQFSESIPPGVGNAEDFLFIDTIADDIEIITFDGGVVNSFITLTSGNNLTFNLNSGMIGGTVRTGSGDDTFILGEAFRFGDDNSIEIDGGGDTDTFMLAADFTPTSVSLSSSNVLTLTLTGGTTLRINLVNIENVMITGLTLAFPDATTGADTFMIEHDIVGDARTRTLASVINGLGGDDTLELNAGAVVGNILFRSDAPTDPSLGNVHLQSVEIITIDGGMVNGDITSGTDALTLNMMSGAINGNVTGGTAADIFNLDGGTITGNVDGGAAVDTFNLDGGTITGNLNGGAAADAFNLNGGTVSGDVNGGDGDDTFTIGGSVIVTGTIDGGGGTNTLSLASGFTPSANFFGGVLTLTLTGGGGTLTFNLASNITVDITPLTMAGPLLTLSGTPGNDVVSINVDIAGNVRARTLASVIDGGGGGADRFTVGTGGIVANVLFSSNAPDGSGNVHLQGFENIWVSGGTVEGSIDASAAPEAITFDIRTTAGTSVIGDVTGSSHADAFTLRGGTIGGNVNGGDGNDTFALHSAIRISGHLDGQGGTNDSVQYAGAPGTPSSQVFTFAARSGLIMDTDTRNGGGSVRNIENQQNIGTITSLSVRNIEGLAFSPALNLYGALSDALMQFGQQTAQGFALADMTPQTGRLTQLISKASPFTKGRIWAHKITHSGNGKGSIGLNLTGLTARAPSDYDYQMNLTQHGFDAPVVSSQWGDFGLRAVSHTMTGMIETNTAEAQVSGYGAGVAWLWQSSSLAANLTALAGAYEVDAHTSPSNPQAVVNEVSEGSFSAINAVISAGVADKRELANGLVMRTTADVSWQTLSLDDFTETGADGIIVNFDKATRFTARIGAGLEGEHWFSDVAFVHETSSGGTLSSGLRQDYRQHDGTAIEMKFGGKMADLASGLTIKAFAAWRQSVSGLAGEPSAQFELSYRF